MSAQLVDVHAVMRRAATALENNGSRRIAGELGEAWAVVEEVIAAGRAVFGEHEVDPEGLERLSAALARCGGQ